jgi:glycosyltransferase involved in cell wall biosynthesis
MGDPLAQSFFLGGFESSTMRRRDGRRNDLLAATRHDAFAAEDYARLREVGITAAREGTVWHELEPRRGRFVEDSVVGRIRAAERNGIQAIWDLCHFGWPDDVDPFAADFPDRLAAFASWFAQLLRDESSSIPWYVPVNEPSFVAWAGGDVEYLNPFARGRGDELKRQLVRAAVAAAAAVRSVDPRARICHVDPIIHIEPLPGSAESSAATIAHNEAQYDAWDMLAGRRHDELGGSESELDVIGVNFYDRNQWVDRGPTLQIGEPGFRPLREMLAAVHERYRRPILIAETGAEGTQRVPWVRYVCDEVVAARAAGIPVEGICLYPIVDHPGWDNDRHVPVGVWGYPDSSGRRRPYSPLVEELGRQTCRFARAVTDGQTATDGSQRRTGEPVRLVAGRRSTSTSAEGRKARAIVLVTDSRAPSGMGRQMLSLARGLGARHRVVISGPDAVDGRWVLDAASAAGLVVWRLTDGSPAAQAAMFADLIAADAIDLVNVHAGIGWEGHLAVAAARSAGATVVVRTEHLPFLLTKPRERSEYRMALRGVDRVIAVSEGVARSYAAAGVTDAMLRTVANGIDEPEVRADASTMRRALGIDRSAPLLVSVGRITSQKGYDVLLAAVPAVLVTRPDARFVIVGSGPLAGGIDAAIRDLRVEHAVLRLPSCDDVPALLTAADALVMASRFEGLPLVALEAMACERPIIGTRVCGLEETVEDGVTGRLVPPDDPAALSAAILGLIRDPILGLRFGRAGRLRYEARFSARRMVDETVAVYAELLDRPAAERARRSVDVWAEGVAGVP